jgi:hypothetical protein
VSWLCRRWRWSTTWPTAAPTGSWRWRRDPHRMAWQWELPRAPEFSGQLTLSRSSVRVSEGYPAWRDGGAQCRRITRRYRCWP